jgi:flagellar hook protein FlgE
VVNTSNVPGDIKLPIGVTLSPSVTTNITMTGNFSNEAAYPGDPAGSVTGATQQMSVKVYDANGSATPMVATFTK